MIGAFRHCARARRANCLYCVERKRKYIGRIGLSHVLRVQFGHCLLINKDQRQFGIAPHTFGCQYVDCKPLPSRDVDDNIVLLVGSKNFYFAFATNAARLYKTWPHLVSACPMCTGGGSNLFVGRNNVGNDSVTNHVIGVQMDKREVLDASENALDT
ncbi:unannotated protein [freshwater metagenome]|uniref:Unannotated protein n=1 Tax=freshwater metagenome TaxID=449393 RepID=A0A6J6L004_9ZZZZ